MIADSGGKYEVSAHRSLFCRINMDTERFSEGIFCQGMT